jgi:hypothetical protein
MSDNMRKRGVKGLDGKERDQDHFGHEAMRRGTDNNENGWSRADRDSRKKKGGDGWREMGAWGREEEDKGTKEEMDSILAITSNQPIISYHIIIIHSRNGCRSPG